MFNWTWEIKEEGNEVLDEIIKYMKDVDDVRVELAAHTDSHGSAAQPGTLSAESPKLGGLHGGSRHPGAAPCGDGVR